MYHKQDIVRKVGKVKKQLAFARYCFSRGDDEWFTGEVRKLGKTKNVVELSAPGEDGAEVFYHIFIPATYAGFFASYNKVLSYLYFADRYHLTPVVEYDKAFPYAETGPVNGSTNPFEYYFRQPGGIPLAQMQKSAVVLECRRENNWLVNELNEKAENYVRSQRQIQEMGRIVRKYIRLQPQVEALIRMQTEALLKGKKTLGVHVRGTDYKWNYNGHPVCVTAEEYLEQAKALADQSGYEQIFLATDDLTAVSAFRDAFGERLVYYEDVTRSDGKVTVMRSQSSRENHHYLLGLEVLRDMLTLAACDGLVAGLSHVSYAVRFQKVSYEQSFEDLVILNKGINEHTQYNCPK